MWRFGRSGARLSSAHQVSDVLHENDLVMLIRLWRPFPVLPADARVSFRKWLLEENMPKEKRLMISTTPFGTAFARGRRAGHIGCGECQLC